MTETETKPALVPTEVIFLGRRPAAKAGQVGYAFITFPRLAFALTQWNDGKSQWITLGDCVDWHSSLFLFTGNREKPNRIGGVYEFPADVRGDGSIQTLSSGKPGEKYRRMSGHELEATWQAQDESASLKLRAEKIEAKGGDALASVLDRLQFIYATMPPQQREPFKLMVLGAMTTRKGRGK